jgi:hypothetical protein
MKRSFNRPCRFSGPSGDELVTAPRPDGRGTRKESTMKYVLMFTSHTDMSAGGDTEQTQALYKRVYEWFQEQGAAGTLADSGAELHPVSMATTVKYGEDGPVVVDVKDMDEAIAITRSWPMLDLPGVAVEIRPMVEDYSQFE